MINQEDDGANAGRADASPGHVRRLGGQLGALAMMTLVFGLSTTLLGVYGALAWSLVPIGVSGTIDRVDYQSDTGSRFREVTFDGGRTLVIDRQVADLFARGRGWNGQVVHKQPWSQSIRIGDRTEWVSPSVEFWKVLFTLSAVAVVAVARSLHPHRRRTFDLGEPEPAGAVP